MNRPCGDTLRGHRRVGMARTCNIDSVVCGDRLRRPAAQASHRLRPVHQRLLYSSRSPYALYLLLCNTNTGARALAVTLLSPTSLAAVFASLCPAHSFFADMCTDPSFFTVSEYIAPLQTPVARACARCTLTPAEIRHRIMKIFSLWTCNSLLNCMLDMQFA